MSKNKLIWNSVLMFLIAIISLPIAYAQEAGFKGSRLFFILINSAIIFVVLFILQSYLIQGKDSKEKPAVWVIMIIASLLLGWLYGQTGYIWQGPLGIFFNIKVLVNAVIIGAVLYFLLGWIGVNQKLGLSSPQGQTGYGILLFLIAVIFAVKLGNQWIWKVSTIKTLVDFFLGNEGILTTNKNRIFVFIGSAVLLSWFFNFLAIGKENYKINYALAIIFAAHMASGTDPYTIGNVKTLVLFVGTWVLGKNMSENFTGYWKIAGYIIAFVMVYWAVSTVETAVTPEGKVAVAGKGEGKGVFGWASSIFGVSWQILKFIIILGIGVLTYIGIKKLTSRIGGGTS